MSDHIEWKDEYSLGIDILDNQHRQFLELMDQAYTAFYKKESKEELGILLSDLKDYTYLHFSTEEKYFDLFHYELKDMHIEYHTKLKEQLAVLMKNFEIKGLDTVPALVDFLENWLVVHLEHEDKKYVRCFKEHGL